MIIEIDFLYRWAVLERRPNHVNKQPSGCWHLTFDCFLNLDMRDDTNTKFLLLRVQTAYDLGNERWLFGDIIDHVGIYGSRLAEGLSASNVGLVIFLLIHYFTHIAHHIILNIYQNSELIQKIYADPTGRAMDSGPSVVAHLFVTVILKLSGWKFSVLRCNSDMIKKITLAMTESNSIMSL